MTRIITISGGLARVGKTHLAVNLALEMARRGRQVAVYNQTGPRSSIDNLLALPQTAILQRRSTDRGDSLVRRGYQGIDLLSSGIPLSQWDTAPAQAVEEVVADMDCPEGYDDFLVDTSGMDPRTQLACCRAASLVILIITPDARSCSEAFALLRVLQLNGFSGQLYLLVNRVDQSIDADELHHEFNRVLNRHLGMDVPLLGMLTNDVHVGRAERSRQAFSSLFPDAEASSWIVVMADALDEAWSALPGVSQSPTAYWNAFRSFLALPVSLPGGALLDVSDFGGEVETSQPQPARESGREMLLLQLDSSFHEFPEALDSLPGLLQATAEDVSSLHRLLQETDESGIEGAADMSRDSGTLLHLAVSLVREIEQSVMPAQMLQLQVHENRVRGDDPDWLQAGCYLKYVFRFPDQDDILLQIKSILASAGGFRQLTGQEGETIREKVVADRSGSMNIIHVPGDSIRMQVWLPLGGRQETGQNSRLQVEAPVLNSSKMIH